MTNNGAMSSSKLLISYNKSFLKVRLHGYNYSQSRSSKVKTDLIKEEASRHSDMKALSELDDVSHICNSDTQNVVESVCMRHECTCTVDLVHTVYTENQFRTSRIASSLNT